MNVLTQLLKVLLPAALMTITASAATAQTKSVLVTSIVEHHALDAVRDGVADELKDAGYIAGKNLRWEFQSAQGNMATAGQIARKFAGDNAANVIVAISTASAQPMLAATKTIPIVFSAVADPIAARLAAGWVPTKTNVTGVSNMLDPIVQADLIQETVPNVKNVGIVYNPGEPNSVSALDNLKAVLEKRGVTIRAVAAPRTVDVAPAAKSLLGKVDAMYSTTDNNVMSVYEALVKVCNDAKLPLIGSDPDAAKRGASVGLGIDFYQLGRETGKVVVRILKGEQAGDIAPAPGKKTLFVVNKQAAHKQGVTISSALLSKADKVID